MLRVLFRLTRGYRLRPWRSPYLRWRIETYWGWHADRITFAQFWSFVWRERKELWRYARWADRHQRRIASGLNHRSPGNRAKSTSVETSSA